MSFLGWGKNEFNDLNTEYPKMVDAPIVSESSCLRSSPGEIICGFILITVFNQIINS